MNKDTYFSTVKKRLGRYFTISEHVSRSGLEFDIDAEFAAHEDHTLLFKENVMDYSNSIEHCLFLYTPELSSGQVKQIAEKVPVLVDELTKPSRYHKCTVIKVIIVTDRFVSSEDEGIIQKVIRKFRFSRTYMLFLHGWSEAYLFVEDIGRHKEYKCRGMKKTSYLVDDAQEDIKK